MQNERNWTQKGGAPFVPLDPPMDGEARNSSVVFDNFCE